MLGVCGARDDGAPLNCVSSGAGAAAVAPSAPGMPSLADVEAACPELDAERICCDAAQFEKMKRDVAAGSGLFLGCPACRRNFINFFCDIACSGNQSEFVRVTEVVEGEVNMAWTLDVLVDAGAGEAMYASCASVTSPNGFRVLDLFGAQDFGGWTAAMGTRAAEGASLGSPYQMNFPHSENASEALNRVPHACDDPELRCSCGDCPSAKECPSGGSLMPGSGSDGPGGREECRVAGFLTCGFFNAMAGTYVLAMVCASVLYRWRENGMKVFAVGGYGSTSEGGVVEEGAEEEQPPPQEREEVELYFGERFLRQLFSSWGRFVARHAKGVLAVALALGVGLSSGLAFLEVETDPERLWSRPDSVAAVDKRKFTQAFGPLFRTAMLIVSPLGDAEGDAEGHKVSDGSSPDNFLTADLLDALFDVHMLVSNVSASSITLDDVCYRPMEGGSCLVESPLQWWALDRARFDADEDVAGHAKACLTHYDCYSCVQFSPPLNCIGAEGVPADPRVVLGGFRTDRSSGKPAFETATSAISTYLLKGDAVQQAAAWEEAFEALVLTEVAPLLKAKGLAVSVFTDSSVERELARSSGADAGVIGFSYAAMFVYIALAIGGLNRTQPIPREGVFADVPPPVPDDSSYVKTLRKLRSRVILGLGGVTLVALSVTSAAGVCAFAGVKGSGIVAEVIPFLILAVGVDNLFLLVDAVGAAHASVPLDEMDPSEAVSRGLEKAGPSVLMAACCEILCFCVSTLVGMPAVRSFALFASTGIVLNLVLQLSAFPALLGLELGMQAQEWHARLERAGSTYQALAGGGDEEEDEDGDGGIGEEERDAPSSGVSAWFVEDLLAPCLSIPAVQLGVLVLSGFSILSSIAEVVNHLQLGLEQASVLPRTSHLQNYFRDLRSELRTGPPVWFVVEGGQPWANYSDVSVQNAICGANPGCDSHSMLSLLAEAARRPAETTIAAPATSWLDDYLLWAKQPGCCRLYGDSHWDEIHQLCPPEDQPPCTTSPGEDDACRACTSCLSALQRDSGDVLSGRVQGPDFMKFLPFFFEAAPSAACSKGGRGPYTGDVELCAGAHGTEEMNCQSEMPATRFRTMHTPLSTQGDFIAAITHGRTIASKLGSAIQDILGLRSPGKVFAHSVFYVFFDQYVGLVGEAATALGVSFIGISGCVLFLSGSARLAILVATSAAMVVVQLLGLMAAWDIELNALSLVNLAMAAGIAVEFTAHSAHRYITDAGTRPPFQARGEGVLCPKLAHRATRALKTLKACGPTVLSGITLTKVVGISVLHFAPSRVIVVYYYRLYLGLVAFGAFQGLVVLPVLLTLFGPV